MPGLEDLYREIILDHYRTPRNRGELPTPPAVVAQGHNPLCGDEITVYLQLDGDVVDDVKVGGQGCSISQSSASMMSQAIKGRTRRRGARPRAPVQGDDVDRGRRAADGDGDGDARRRARRPRGAAGRRQVPGAHQVRHARLEHAARRARPAGAGLSPSVDDAEERARAGRAIRDLGHAFVGHHAPPELLDEVASTLDELTARLDAGEPRDRAMVRSGEEWTARRWPSATRRWRATTTGRSPGGRARGASTSRCTATATRSRRVHAARRPRGRAGAVARRRRRRAVRRRVRVRARRRPGAGVHRRADDPLRAADAAAPAARLPRPPGRPRGAQAVHRGRAGRPRRRRASRSSPAAARSFITVDPAVFAESDRQAARPTGRGPRF